MARTKPRQAGKHAHSRFSGGPRPIWSGIVSFGLVTLPISLYPASRSKHSVLHMVDETGTQLKRRYQCAKEQKMLTSAEIVRGYEIEKDRFIPVDDDELKALAPEKSSGIDLQRFVSLDQINPIYFDKDYFLAPDADAVKAYRLLAESMQQENRAGIATFVMRDREYLVAIIAQEGILRAQTLRFYDEIRTPEDVGLDELQQASPKDLAAMRDAFAALSTEDFDPSQLLDKQMEDLQKKVQKKLKSGKDIVREHTAPPSAKPVQPEEPASADIIDLMELIKARIKGQTTQSVSAGDSQARPASKRKAKDAGKATPAKAKSGPATHRLNGQSRSQLYQQAQQQNIAGRSKMSKEALIEALSALR